MKERIKKIIPNQLMNVARKIRSVDLGCGDFSFGSKICGLFYDYTACDIVQPLIARNSQIFASLKNVKFLHLDLSQDVLPVADIVFIRQVLQHLSNDAIAQLLPKLFRTYKYVVLTEHLTVNSKFVANIDKPSGPDTRITVNSGVVLTEPPFQLKHISQKIICENVENGGRIQTVFFKLCA